MKKRGAIMAGFVAAAMGLGSAAANAAIVVDPNGSAGSTLGVFDNAFNISALKMAAGNSLAQGSLTAIGNGVGSEFNLYYQAKVQSFTQVGGGSPLTLLNNTNGAFPTYEWTVVAGLRERVASVVGTTANFELVEGNGAVNFFEVYYDDTPDANNLAGTGFANGRLILRAAIVDMGASNFSVQSFSPVQLDQTPAGTDGGGPLNDYGAAQTVQGSGNTSTLTAQITEFDPTFFSGDIGGLFLSFLVAQDLGLSVPFTSVDPAGAFTTAAYTGSIGSTNNGGTYAPGTYQNSALGAGIPGSGDPGSVGAINGLNGPDVVFATIGDVNFESFDRPSIVPEPATAGLGLMGLTALALGLRRRRQA